MNYYGFSLLLCFLVSSFIYWKVVKRRGVSQERSFDDLLVFTIFALIFSRIDYVIFHWDIFSTDWGRIFLISRYPGFSLLGLIFGGITSLVFNYRKELERFWVVGDMFAPSVAMFGFGASILNAIFIRDNFQFIIGAGYFGLYLLLQFIIHGIDHWPEVKKHLDRDGFLTLFLIIFIFGVNFPLAFLRSDNVYYFWIFGLWLTTTIFLSRYRKVFKSMIKFPAHVLSQIKKFLEDRKVKTEKQIAELKKEDPFADTDRLLDNAEQGAEAEEKAGHERIQALTRQLNIGLIEIKKALSKIKVGKYGVCEICGKMIDTDRLAAIPTATKCVSCERKKEK